MNASAPAPSTLPLVVLVDHRVESLNRLMNEHHYARAKRRTSEYAATKRALQRSPVPALPQPGEPPLVVRFVRLGPMLTDSDNLAIAFKIPRDACAAWLGVSDGPRESRVRWEYGQEILRERLPVPVCGPRPKHVYAVRFRIEITRGDAA